MLQLPTMFSTVTCCTALANVQLDAQIFDTFITILYMYMFRAISFSSSGGQIASIQHLISSLTATRYTETLVTSVMLILMFR